MRQNHHQALFFIPVIFLLCARCTPLSQAKGTGRSVSAVTATIPFVGCKSDGQVGPLHAPTGLAPAMTIPPAVAGRLAYYKAKDGFGVLAPRGWHCFSTYGSNGSNLFVSPGVINATTVFSTSWKGFVGPAVQISVSNGGTSGRFQVAEVIARVFPSYRQFTRDVIAEDIEPASSFPFGSYPRDKLKYLSKSVVEFETPANTKGLGTASWLRADSIPIRGVAILLLEGDTNLVQLSARLPAQESDLTSIIIQQIEREATHVVSQ